MDTSFSQGRSATYSQTACLKHKSGDIVRVEKHMDICIESKVPLSVINTDECGQLANLFKRKSEKQSLKILELSRYHKMTRRSKTVEKQNFNTQKFSKLFTTLDYLKIEGLSQLLIQMEVAYSKKQLSKKIFDRPS